MSFRTPAKAIVTPAQLEYFQTSPTHNDILAYVGALNDAVVGVKLSAPCFTSDVCLRSKKILSLILRRA